MRAKPFEMQTPLERFLEHEKKNPDAIFFNQPIAGKWHTYTFRQVGDEVRKIAAYIHSLNLPRGSRIGLVSKNCAHWIMSDLAIMLSGNVSVPLYPNINAKTIRYVMEHSEAKVLFVGKLDDWDSMKSGVPDNVHCISFPFYGPEGYKKWDDILKSTQPLAKYDPIRIDDLLTIVYTSGTTGNPKGVMLRCKAISYAMSQALTVLDLGKKRHRLFSYLPLSHIAERMFVEINCLWIGAEVFFAESLDLFVKNLQEAQPTLFIGVPRIWTKFQMGILEKLPQKKMNTLLSIPIVSSLIKNKIRKGLGLHKTEYFFSGAAPIPAALLAWYQKLGVNIQEVYAMTENCAYSHFTRHDNIKIGHAGQPMPGVEVKISENGELLVKSEANMDGYYKEPELTAKALKDGWLHTGDTAVIDSEGFVKITGRVKEIFKTDKGKYVSPTPIEMSLLKDQHIEQVCVVGANLPQPIALIVLSEDARKKQQDSVKQSLHSTLEVLNPTLESHERLNKMVVVKETWTVENNVLTPSLKIKRGAVEERYNGNFLVWYSQSETVVWES